MADDIISQGDEGEPGPWPRRLAVLAVLVVLVVVAVRLFPHSRSGPVRDRGTQAVAGPVLLAGLGNAVTADLDESGLASHSSAHWPSGQRLLLTAGPALVLAGHRAARSDQRPACRRLRLRIQPGGRWLGGPA